MTSLYRVAYAISTFTYIFMSRILITTVFLFFWNTMNGKIYFNLFKTRNVYLMMVAVHFQRRKLLMVLSKNMFCSMSSSIDTFFYNMLLNVKGCYHVKVVNHHHRTNFWKDLWWRNKNYFTSIQTVMKCKGNITTRMTSMWYSMVLCLSKTFN